MQNNKFIELIQSTLDLHSRFETKQTVKQAAERVVEEYEECINAVEDENLKLLREEIVDVFVTLIGLTLSFTKSNDGFEVFKHLWEIARVLRGIYAFTTKYEITYDLLVPYMDLVIKKNNSKTFETHFLNDKTGKIERKPLEVKETAETVLNL